MMSTRLKQIVSIFPVLIILSVASFLLSSSGISSTWMAGQKDHYMTPVKIVVTTNDHNPGHDDSQAASVKQLQECSLKKQWRPTNTSASSACPKAWPLALNGVGCCNKKIASIAYTSENHNSSGGGGRFNRRVSDG